MPLYLALRAWVLAAPLGSMLGELELLAEDLGELVDAELDLEEVLALTLAGLLALAGPLALVPLALAHAFLRFLRSATGGRRFGGRGIETSFPPWRPMSSPLDMYLRRSLADAAFDDVAEPPDVAVDVEHGGLLWRASALGGVAAGEDAGDVLEHVGRGLFVVAEVPMRRCFTMSIFFWVSRSTTF
jgi:hypothetical protein